MTIYLEDYRWKWDISKTLKPNQLQKILTLFQTNLKFPFNSINHDCATNNSFYCKMLKINWQWKFGAKGLAGKKVNKLKCKHSPFVQLTFYSKLSKSVINLHNLLCKNPSTGKRFLYQMCNDLCVKHLLVIRGSLTLTSYKYYTTYMA